jgi:hypothetical protein
VKTFEHEEYFNGTSTNTVSISGGGMYAAVGSKNGALLVFNLVTGDVEKCFKG